ncbi:MAG: hypothetical protein ACJAYG_002115 [Oceanicoccus sp.]|jgi:hypothetical protein
MCKTTSISVIAASVLLLGCDNNSRSSGEAPAPYSYEITVSNLTLGQPLSPIAIIAHDGSYELFSIGSVASVVLEMMAEDGDNNALLADAESAGALTTLSGTAPVGPSATDTFTVELTAEQAITAELSISTMLVNSNDAFAAVSSSLALMTVDQSVVLTGISYDSGTEANSEAAGTIPGPADGGTGFDASRDDIADRVTMHSGVISADDGLAGSTLSQLHRWDNPVIRVTITRTQ